MSFFNAVAQKKRIVVIVLALAHSLMVTFSSKPNKMQDLNVQKVSCDQISRSKFESLLSGQSGLFSKCDIWQVRAGSGHCVNRSFVVTTM